MIFCFRYIYPVVIGAALVRRRRNEREASKSAERLGSSVAQVVGEAKEGARTLRVLTYWLVLLTVCNVGLVAYLVFK